MPPARARASATARPNPRVAPVIKNNGASLHGHVCGGSGCGDDGMITPIVTEQSDPLYGRTVTAVPTRGSQRLSRAAREARILDTAQRLFYARGVHEVGMDELVRETGLGKATVYRLYPTKDALVAAYLARLAATILHEIDTLAADSADPARALIGVLAAVEQDLRRPQFRGCAFNNASIEFDDPGHPARTEARRYREQLVSRLTELAEQLAGRRRGTELGRQLAVLVDGAYTSAAHLGPDGPAAAGLKLARDLVKTERSRR